MAVISLKLKIGVLVPSLIFMYFVKFTVFSSCLMILHKLRMITSSTSHYGGLDWEVLSKLFDFKNTLFPLCNAASFISNYTFILEACIVIAVVVRLNSIQQIFIGALLFVRQYSKCWRCNSEQKVKYVSLRDYVSEVGRQH